MIDFKLRQHSVLPGRQIVEVWDGDQFIATITPGDTSALRVVSKHPLLADVLPEDPRFLSDGKTLKVVQVHILPEV